jgi:hypothetical protein
VITTSSPVSTAARSAESWALASARPTLRMANQPTNQQDKVACLGRAGNRWARELGDGTPAPPLLPRKR